MSDKYNLYYTLNSVDVKSTPLSARQKTSLRSFLASCDIEQKKAVVLIIIEHSKVVDNCVYDSANVDLPYGMYETTSDTVIMLDQLPNELHHILHKFALATKKK